MSKMSLQEQQMFKANVELQDEVKRVKEDIKVLIEYINGYIERTYIVDNIIKKYVNCNQENRFCYGNKEE